MKRGLTQESLAEMLDVSPQSVSRWESGTSYPDMELLPSIANLFSMTTDELLGMQEIRAEYDLRRIFTEVIDLEKSGDYDAAAGILRDALMVYPANDGLMCELAMTLGQTGREDDRTEAIVLSERVLALSKNDKVRATTKAHLCLLYRDAQMIDRARQICSTLPHIWESREMVAALLSDDGDALARAQSIAAQVLSDLTENRHIAFSSGYRFS
ncbi:MAG: helix-turn-helix transcriptional regulator [Clostridia bacterium]|nr:helix-turn-helix transcriptional regulator [Clostridia bacterium]